MVDVNFRKGRKSQDGFYISQMIRRKYAIVKTDDSGESIRNTMHYSIFKKEDIDAIKDSNRFKLRGYISADKLNKIFDTKNLFKDSHIRVDDTEKNLSYLFIDA